MPAPITTDDGVELEAEWGLVDTPRAAVVLCHPHPLYGGTMRSIVTGALFEALPAAGVSCVRFNFRGVGRSTGRHSDGDGERLDARAVLTALADEVTPDVPIVMSGWSFGADMALSVVDDRLAGWLAIAVPLRWGDHAEVSADARPKRLLLAQHDEFQPPAEVEAQVATWTNTDVDTIPGASHFFVGRTNRVTELTLAFIDTLA